MSFNKAFGSEQAGAAKTIDEGIIPNLAGLAHCQFEASRQSSCVFCTALRVLPAPFIAFYLVSLDYKTHARRDNKMAVKSKGDGIVTGKKEERALDMEGGEGGWGVESVLIGDSSAYVLRYCV